MSPTKKQSIGERLVFWIGSLSGIIVALVTIYDRAIRPSPATLAIRFFESGATDLNLVMPVNTASEVTEAIPLQLRVENVGGSAATNVKLYLTYPPTMQLRPLRQADSTSTWNAPNEPMTQLALVVDKLNPGEPLLIPVIVRFRVTRDEQRATIQLPSAGDPPRPIAFVLYTDLSSETVASTRTELRVMLGRCATLSATGSDVFWIGHGDEGIRVLKVLDDYPCH